MTHRIALLGCLITCTTLLAAAVPTTRQARVNLGVPVPKEFKLDAVPLANALETFSQASGANLYVDWHSLEAVGIPRDFPITWPGTAQIRASDTMGDLLNRVLQIAGNGKAILRYFVDGDVVIISTETNLDALARFGQRDEPEPTPKNDAVAAELDASFTIALDGGTLGEAVDLIRENSRLNVFINWRALEVAGIDRKSPVTLRLRDVKLSSALRVLLAEAAAGRAVLGYVVEDGVLTVSTQDDLGRNTLTRVYDVRDITKGKQPDELIESLLATVAPFSWRDRGGAVGSVRELSGQLIVTQTADAHRAIAGWLQQQRPAGAEKPREFPLLGTRATTRPAP